jgi:flagellin-like hook-associated protein FlgL
MADISDFDQTASDLGLNGPIGSQLIGADLNPGVSFEISETSGTTAADLGLRGVIYNDFAGDDLNPQLTVDSELSSLRNRQGLSEGTIVIHQGERRLSIDLSDPLLVTVQDFLDRINGSSLDLTASLNPDGTGIQIVNNDPTRSLTIEDDGNGRVAKDLGIYGSSDMMGTLLVLSHALRNDDGEGAGILLEHLDASIQSVLDVRSDIGTRAIRLETTDNRLQDMELNFTKLLSEVEDADLADVLSKLSTHEANYQAALMAGAKIIQPSLLDFLSR